MSVTGDTANVAGVRHVPGGRGNAADYSTMTAGAAYDNTTALGTDEVWGSRSTAARPAAYESISVNLDGGRRHGGHARLLRRIRDQHGKTLTFNHGWRPGARP